MPASKRTKILILLAFPAGTLIFVAFLFFLVGRDIDPEHTITRSAVYPESTEVLWKIITDVEALPTWRPEITSVETSSTTEGTLAWRECASDGSCSDYKQKESEEDTFSFSLQDEGGPVSRTWSISLEPVGSSTRVRITEEGKITKPLQRFVAKYVLRYNKSLERYLNDLAAHLNHDLPFPEHSP